jgi:Tol biopolymer transport system component
MRRRAGRGRGALLVALALAAGLLHVSANAYPRPGTLERLTVGVNGAQAKFAQPVLADCRLVRTTDPCTTAISATGRYIVFSSPADNLVPNDKNHAPDVFLRDQQTGRTELVSVSALTGGSATVVPNPVGTAGTFQPDVSADGRYVVFTSSSLDLVVGKKAPTFDVFVRDRTTRTVERISLGLNGVDALGDSTAPVISADGRYVAYESDAPNLVPGDTNLNTDVFEYDRKTKQTVRLSLSSQGVQGNFESHDPSISADGRYVAFTSSAENLVPGDTHNPVGS